jgi:hypothetical protein
VYNLANAIAGSFTLGTMSMPQFYKFPENTIGSVTDKKIGDTTNNNSKPKTDGQVLAKGPATPGIFNPTPGPFKI